MHVEGYGGELRAANLIRQHLVPDFNVAIRNLGKFAEFCLHRRDEKLAATRRPGLGAPDVPTDIKPALIDDRLAAIIQNHDAAETELDGFTLTPSADNANLFTMQSPDKSLSFTISKLFDACPEHCALRCRDCRVCVHTYECTCRRVRAALHHLQAHPRGAQVHGAAGRPERAGGGRREHQPGHQTHGARPTRARQAAAAHTSALPLHGAQAAGDHRRLHQSAPEAQRAPADPPARSEPVRGRERRASDEPGPASTSQAYAAITKAATAYNDPGDAGDEAEDDDWTPDKELVLASAPRRRPPEPALDSSQSDIISRPAIKRSRAPLSPTHSPPPSSSSINISTVHHRLAPLARAYRYRAQDIIKTPSSRVLVVYPVEQRAQSMT